MTLRVGRITYDKKGQHIPSYDGFSPIICMTRSSAYGSLSPYELRDNNQRNIENLWQFSKIYKNVDKTTSHYSRFDKTVIWEHPAEKHIDDVNKPTLEYWAWRRKGMNTLHAVRYPVGFTGRHQCKGAIWEETVHEKTPETELDIKSDKFLDYIEARKKIYLPLYLKYVKGKPQFKKLVERYKKGEKLLILEIDGPHQESLPYYQETYNVDENWIRKDTIEISDNSLSIMLNDSKHPFGHGYCLAWAIRESSIHP